MKATVTKDTGTRTIELALEGLPDVDVTESWHKDRKYIRPDKATIHIHNGETRSIVVFGGVVKKSGQPSEHVRTSRTFTPRAYREPERIETAPGWVRELFAQAPLGVTAFTWQTDEEAQVL